jgi:ribosome-binding factor A
VYLKHHRRVIPIPCKSGNVATAARRCYRAVFALSASPRLESRVVTLVVAFAWKWNEISSRYFFMLKLIFVMRHKRSIPHRHFRIADQIQRDLSSLVRELKDPRVGVVTFHTVEVTPDYAHAKVFFSVLVGDPQASEQGLNEAAGFLRNGLFKRLQIHTVPTLHFLFDATTERAAHLNALIAQANATHVPDEDAP